VPRDRFGFLERKLVFESSSGSSRRQLLAKPRS
jgi:hypothetical protein